MGSRRKGVATACAVTVWSTLLLCGCSFASDPQPTPVALTSPTSSAIPTPTASTTAPELELGAVVATGRLVGDPLISGEVDVRVGRKGAFELHLLNFRSEHPGEISLGVSPRTVEPGTKCTSSIGTMDYGDPAQYVEPVFPLPEGFTDGDPTFLRTVLVKLFDPVAFEDGCYVSVLSSAVLAWTLPDMRPGLVVTDSGKTGGANGEVTLIDGAPVAYTVAPDDVAAEVAARLGITVDDLFYLNPTRTTIIEYPLFQVGEVLNVSKARR